MIILALLSSPPSQLCLMCYEKELLTPSSYLTLYNRLNARLSPAQVSSANHIIVLLTHAHTTSQNVLD